jgi:hypothetical protein
MFRDCARAGTCCLLLPLLFASAGRASTCQSHAGSSTVDHYFYDATLRLCWAVTVDCQHPERPAKLIPAPSGVAQPAGLRSGAARPSAPAEVIPGRPAHDDVSRLPLVVAGSSVELWKGGTVLIQLFGTAAQTAPLGRLVEVRLPGQPSLLHGIARGAHSVELTQGGMEWHEP